MLFDRAACGSCHGLTGPSVGPSYRAISARYSEDPKGAEIIADSIREGSSGKWCSVQMPPHPDLSEATLKATTQFILSQPGEPWARPSGSMEEWGRYVGLIWILVPLIAIALGFILLRRTDLPPRNRDSGDNRDR